MLRELTKDDWLSWLGIPADRVPQALLLRGTRNLKANYEKHRRHFRDVIEVGFPNGIFEDVLIGVRDNSVVAYASVYGDAMASEITHVFGVLGTPLVIQTGCCGALSGELLAGDIVCATSAGCGEGAAHCYLPGRREVAASPELVERITGDLVAPVALHKGSVWTTSALLAEGKQEIERWGKQGYLAVDMETASTFAVAEYFKMRRLALLFVFDSPGQGAHILLTDAQKQERRAEGERVMLDAVLSLIGANPKGQGAVALDS
jgi:purine-nucleoside phosphorylase